MTTKRTKGQSKKKSAAPLITNERARKILTDYAGLLADDYAKTENLLFGDVPTDRAVSSRHFDDVRGSLLLRGLHTICDELQRRHDARSAEWRQFVAAANAAPTEAKEAERKGLYPAGLEGYGDQYEAFWTALETFQRGISADYAFIIVDLLGTKPPGLLEPENKNFIGYQGGMSQSEFAKKIGKDVKTIKRWESGETPPPKVFDPQLGKQTKYSADLRKDRMSAIAFILYYHQKRANKQGIKNAVQYLGEETDKWNERKRLGYTKSTCEPSATYDGNKSNNEKLTARLLGY